MKAPLLVPLALALVPLVAVPLPGQGPAGRDDDFQLGIGLVRRGLHEDAVPAFERFVARHPEGHPKSAEAWYRLGSCRAELGRDGEAVAALERALEVGGARFALRAEGLYRLAGSLQALGRHDDALRSWRPLLRLTADGDAAYLRAAACYGAAESARAVGRTRDALDWFLEAAAAGAARPGEEQGDDAGYAYAGTWQAGLLCLEEGDHARAQALFSGLAEAFPDRDGLGEVWFLAGEAAFRRGAVDEARVAWTTAVEKGGKTTPDAVLGLGWCAVRSGDPDTAAARFAEMLERHPDHPGAVTARLELGRLQQQRGAAEEAVETLGPLREASGAAPLVVAEARELTGLALLDLGRAEDAEAQLRAALAVEGAGLPAARLQLARGDALAARGAWAEAVEAYEAAAGGDEVALVADALYGQCVCLHRDGRFEDSLARARALIERFGGHPAVGQARFAVAENLFALERWSEARDAYDALGADHPDAAVARFKAAWASYLAGEAADAAARFAAVVEDRDADAARREEALSMVVLARYDADQADAALAAADLYLARHRDGVFLGRTERVAGRVLRARGDLAAASSRLARAAAATAGAGDGAATQRRIRLEQADVLFRQGDFEAAARVYRPLADGGDQVEAARALEGLAWCGFELGDDAAALAAVRRALDHPEADEVSAGVLELAATVHHRAGDHREAAEAARTFLQEHAEHPRAPEVRYALGLALSRLGEAAEARAVLEPLARSGGCERMDRVWYELGWVCRRLDDRGAALAAFEKVVATAREEVGDGRVLADECRLHLAEARLEAGEDEQARALLAAVRSDEHRPRALYRLGLGLLAADRAADAVEPLEQLAATACDLQQEGRYLLGEALSRSGRHDDALAPLRELIRGAPDHERAQDARLRFGASAVEAGRHAEAVGVLSEWGRRDEASRDDAAGGDPAVAAPERDTVADERTARAHVWLGRAHAARGEHERAEEAFARAVARTDTEIAAEALYRIGRSREARGDLPAAAEAWVRLSVLYAQRPWVPRGLEAAARAYDELGQPAKAKRFRDELAERYPDHADGGR